MYFRPITYLIILLIRLIQNLVCFKIKKIKKNGIKLLIGKILILDFSNKIKNIDLYIKNPKIFFLRKYPY